MFLRSWDTAASEEFLLSFWPTNRTCQVLWAQKHSAWNWAWREHVTAGRGSSSPAPAPLEWDWKMVSGEWFTWWKLHSSELKRTLGLRWGLKDSVLLQWNKLCSVAADLVRWWWWGRVLLGFFGLTSVNGLSHLWGRRMIQTPRFEVGATDQEVWRKKSEEKATRIYKNKKKILDHESGFEKTRCAEHVEDT